MNICNSKDKNRIIIFFDEAQNFKLLAKENYDYFEDKFKAFECNCDEVKGITFIVAGSEPTIMNEMLGGKKSIFKEFSTIKLKGLDCDSFKVHFESACRDNNKTYSNGIDEAIYLLSGGIATYIASIGSHLITASEKELTSELIIEAISLLLKEEEGEFKRMKKELEVVDSGMIVFTKVFYSIELNDDDLNILDKLEALSIVVDAKVLNVLFGLWCVSDGTRKLVKKLNRSSGVCNIESLIKDQRRLIE